MQQAGHSKQDAESSKKQVDCPLQNATYCQLQATRSTRWQVAFIVFIGLAITACEYVFAYQNVAYGIVIALGLVILIYVTLSLFYLDERITNCAESLTLLPLYILFTASLPWFFINQQYLLPAVYSCILALCLWYVYQKKLSLREIFGFSNENAKLESRNSKTGFAYYLSLVLMGAGIGVLLGTGEYFILYPATAFPSFEVKYLLRDMVYMLCFVGIGEELLFRGLIQRSLMDAFGWKRGLVAASIIFAVMHLTWRSIPELIFVLLAGLILGGLYWKTKSLVAPIVAHGINNVILVSVLPYIVS